MSLLSLAAAVLIAQPALADDVQLRTADGLQLHGIHEPVAGATRGVLLVHGEGRTANDWKFLQGKLEHNGFSSLAIDLRGHGGSQVPAGDAQSDEAFQAMTADVTAGLAFLREHGASELMIVGADLGANLALGAGSDVPEVRNAVLLSPGLKIHGLRADAALKAWGDRPVLMVVSNDDPYAAKSALLLEAQARGPKHLEIYAAAGKGATMLNREPACEGLVMSWLLGSHALQTEQARSAGPTIDGGAGALQTDGPTMQEVLGGE